ncbi:MAG: hypothetical protein ACOCQA_02485 [bacterium]
MRQIIIYYAIAVVFTMVGFLLASIFTAGSKTEEYRQGYISGKREGYRNGYMDCYRGFMGETAQYDGDMNEN